MECGARVMRKSTRPAGRTSKPGSRTPMTRHLGVGNATIVMGTLSLGPYHRGAMAPSVMIPSGYP